MARLESAPSTVDELYRALGAVAPGAPARLDVLRGSERTRVEVTTEDKAS